MSRRVGQAAVGTSPPYYDLGPQPELGNREPHHSSVLVLGIILGDGRFGCTLRPLERRFDFVTQALGKLT